jgi:thioredoxin reductase
LDAGRPRNAAATAVRGMLGLDGVSPGELRERAGRELDRYGVERQCAAVDRVDGTVDDFRLVAGDTTVHARRVLLATGLVDVPPGLPDEDQFWGTSILQCPFCHGWEVADRPLGLVADTVADLDRLDFYVNWSPDLTVFTHGRFAVPKNVSSRLRGSGTRLVEGRITALRGGDGQLERVLTEDGMEVGCEALFLHPSQRQTAVVEALDVEVNDGGFVVVPKDYGSPGADRAVLETSRPGLYAAGDLTSPAQSAPLATFEGSLAGQTILMSLVDR